MGQCLKICEKTFCLKMVDSIAISGRIISILMLDQFSQRKKMRLILAHLMRPRAFFLDAPVQGISYYVERIDLASKLRKF